MAVGITDNSQTNTLSSRREGCKVCINKNGFLKGFKNGIYNGFEKTGQVKKCIIYIQIAKIF